MYQDLKPLEISSKIWHIEFDMDGVLAKFLESYKDLLDVSYEEDRPDEEKWNLLLEKCPDFFARIEPNEHVVNLCRYLHNDTLCFVSILTAIPRAVAVPESTTHKRDWCHKHISPHIKVNFGPYSKDKQFHCKGHKKHLLIDDKLINCEQWEAKGGTAIHFQNVDQLAHRLRELGILS